MANRAPRHGCNRLVSEVRIDDQVARQIKRQRLQLSDVYVRVEERMERNEMLGTQQKNHGHVKGKA